MGRSGPGLQGHGLRLLGAGGSRRGRPSGASSDLPGALGHALRTATELGWRMARPLWGRGLASEAAAAVVEHAFGELAIAELVAYTAVGNDRSQR